MAAALRVGVRAGPARGRGARAPPAFGGVLPFASCCAQPPRPDEASGRRRGHALRPPRAPSVGRPARARAPGGYLASRGRSTSAAAARAGRHGARGERRHRQDVHHRGAGRALRGRRDPARPAPARHLHPHGHGRAARARAGAARLRRAGAGARPGRRAAPATASSGCSPGPTQAVGARRDRLARALAAFDAATIATTHGFCQEVLTGSASRATWSRARRWWRRSTT